VKTVQHGDSWWRQGDDGTWYRWNEAARAWEYAHPTPHPATPPADARYRSPRGLARAVTTLLGAAFVLDLAAVAVFIGELRQSDAVLGVTAAADPPAGDGALRLGMLSAALLAVLLTVVPVFIAWFHRLYSNLPALGAGQLRFGRGWAIGAWFVPFLNLWRPKQIANDIWRASNPDAQDAGWRGQPVAGVVHLWWGLYLSSNLVNQAVVRLSVTAEGAADLRRQALLEIGAAALDAVAALAAMWLVAQMTARQERRAGAVHPT
jgi:hypothetical protein